MRIAALMGMALAAQLVGCAAPTTQRVSVSAQQTASEAQKQLDLLAEDLVAERARLQRVYWRLATHSTTLCPKLTRASGMDLMSLPNSDLASSMSRLFGVTARPTVMSVIQDGPAARAGIKPRDMVLSLWGLPTTEQNAKAIQERAVNAKPGEKMAVQVGRGGQTLDFLLEPVPACNYPPTLLSQQVLNAYADGERIYVTRAMMAFTRTDEELALIVAHEMAHNTMRHIDAKKANAAAGLVGDLALAILSRGAYRSSSISEAAAQAYSQEFEAEADYVGLYMLAHSGYSVQNAPNFWRRMASANPGNIKGSHMASHPPTSYRMVALEEAAKEIEGKRISSALLLPLRKDGKPFIAGQDLLPGNPGAPNDTANCFRDTDGQCMRR